MKTLHLFPRSDETGRREQEPLPTSFLFSLLDCLQPWSGPNLIWLYATQFSWADLGVCPDDLGELNKYHLPNWVDHKPKQTSPGSHLDTQVTACDSYGLGCLIVVCVGPKLSITKIPIQLALAVRLLHFESACSFFDTINSSTSRF